MRQNNFPVIVANALFISMDHVMQFSNPQYRDAKLVKRKTSKGNEVQDSIPLGKIYRVGPSAFYIPLREESYLMEDGGWFPCELLELVK